MYHQDGIKKLNEWENESLNGSGMKDDIKELSFFFHIYSYILKFSWKCIIKMMAWFQKQSKVNLDEKIAIWTGQTVWRYREPP